LHFYAKLCINTRLEVNVEVPIELSDRIRLAFQRGNYNIANHAYARMQQRNITPQEIRALVLEGQAIEAREETDVTQKSIVVLFAGRTKLARALHVVVAEVERSKQAHFVVTVYEPGLDQWDSGFTIRQGGKA
jgi:hypothetical protein